MSQVKEKNEAGGYRTKKMGDNRPLKDFLLFHKTEFISAFLKTLPKGFFLLFYFYLN